MSNTGAKREETPVTTLEPKKSIPSMRPEKYHHREDSISNGSEGQIETSEIPVVDTKDWPGTEHPYEKLWDAIEWAQGFVIPGPRKRCQRQEAIDYIKGICLSIALMDSGRLAEVRAKLREAVKLLHYAYPTLKAAAIEADQLLEEAGQMLGSLIAADEGLEGGTSHV